MRKIRAETDKTLAEIDKINAETAKLEAETEKLERDTKWYFLLVATTIFALIAKGSEIIQNFFKQI